MKIKIKRPRFIKNNATVRLSHVVAFTIFGFLLYNTSRSNGDNAILITTVGILWAVCDFYAVHSSIRRFYHIENIFDIKVDKIKEKIRSLEEFREGHVKQLEQAKKDGADLKEIKRLEKWIKYTNKDIEDEKRKLDKILPGFVCAIPKPDGVYEVLRVPVNKKHKVLLESGEPKMVVYTDYTHKLIEAIEERFEDNVVSKENSLKIFVKLDLNKLENFMKGDFGYSIQFYDNEFRKKTTEG